MKIVTKLVLGTGVLFLAAASVHGTLRVQRELDLFERDLAQDLHALGRAVATALEHEWETSGEASAKELLERIQAAEPHYALSLRRDDAPPPTGAPHGVNERSPPLRVSADAPHLAEVSVPVRVDDGVVAFIDISGSHEDEKGYVRQTIRESIAWTVLLILAMTSLTWVVGLALIGVPTRRLMRAAKRLTEGDLETALVLDRQDELGAIGGALEDMRVRVLTENERSVAAMHARARAEGEAEVERGKRRQLSLQLRHADRLTTVGLLAASVVHDVGAPLSVIAMRAYRLERGVPPDEVAQEAEVIRRQADRAGAMTRRLLDYARLKTPGTGQADVQEAVHRTLELISPLAEQHGVAVEVDIKAAEGPRAAIELCALSQILTNLCTNAVHATPRGGTLTVAVRPTGERVVIEVADTGTGMSDEVKRKLFTPFFTTKPAGKGTGLGLPVVLDFLHEVDGDLRVESQEGVGTRFFVELRAVNAPPVCPA